MKRIKSLVGLLTALTLVLAPSAFAQEKKQREKFGLVSRICGGRQVQATCQVYDITLLADISGF
jgi:hypothetical protein